MFNNLTIGKRLTGAFAIMLLLMVMVAIFGFRSIVTFERDLHVALSTTAAYSNAADTARSAQVNFKLQLQEWKDVLLRGHDSANFKMYKEQFTAREQEVRKDLDKLRAELAAWGNDTGQVDRLLAVHAQLGERYRNALAAFDGQDPLSYRKVDAMVKDMDREPTTQMDKLVQTLLALQTKAKEKADADSGDEAAYLEHFMEFCLLVGLIIAVLLAWSITRGISGPLTSIVETINQLRSGDLSRRLGFDRRDEIGLLANALDDMADGLENKADIAEQIANSNLAVRVTLASDQDQLGKALQKMVVNLTEIISQVQLGANQIDAASNQVSDSSQTLAQGATETAASLEEISSTIGQMASRVNKNAANASKVNQLASETHKSAVIGNRHMGEMVTAMNQINEASGNISKIIQVIDEIAFQTNLLALNAAVEAAHAGQHGKGFAVVAEEVRNLAARSAKAAKETSELIEGAAQKAKNGTEIARKTSDALGEIVGSISTVTSLIGEIASAVNNQVGAIDQVNQGLIQIGEAGQHNSATAEETASAAEELSSQATQMQRMLSQFTLTGQSTSGPAYTQPSALAWSSSPE